MNEQEAELVGVVATAVASAVGALVKEWIRTGNVKALDSLAALCPSADVIEARALALMRSQLDAASTVLPGGGT